MQSCTLPGPSSTEGYRSIHMHRELRVSFKQSLVTMLRKYHKNVQKCDGEGDSLEAGRSRASFLHSK